MTHIFKIIIATSGPALLAFAPVAVSAGTRASDTKIQPVGAAKPASASQGPKNGFPNSPGLQIATIKANENAAFKRKSNGT